MEFLVEWAFGALIVVVGPLLTLLDLPGNTIMLAAGIGYAFRIAKLFCVCSSLTRFSVSSEIISK